MQLACNLLGLGFTYKRFQQGLQYTDGHERDDVRRYRGLYLEKLKYLEASHKPPPTCDDKIPSWNAGNERKLKEWSSFAMRKQLLPQMMHFQWDGMIQKGIVNFNPKAKVRR